MKEKIIFTDYGIGFKIRNKIYLNKNLKKYPKLYKAVLKHEQEHSDSFTKEDIYLDLEGKYLENVKKEYYLFIITHPRSWVQFFPLLIVDNTLTIDIIMLTLWIILFVILMIIINVIRII